MIRYDQPGYTKVVHAVDSRCDGGSVDNIVAVDFSSGQQSFFHHGGFFTMGDQGMNNIGTVNIQEKQYCECDQHIQHGVTHLRIAITAVIQLITF